jgi:hypothetical protein
MENLHSNMELRGSVGVGTNTGMPGVDGQDNAILKTSINAQGAFDAIREVTDGKAARSYLSFSGGGSMLEFTHSTTSSSNIDITVDFGESAGTSYSAENGMEVTVAVVKIEHNAEYSDEQTSDLQKSGTRTQSNSTSVEVVWAVGDPNAKVLTEFIHTTHTHKPL